MYKLTYLFLVIFVWLQYTLWLGKNGIIDYLHVVGEIEQQQQANHQLAHRNQQVINEIDDLKNRLGAIEERARDELGLVKENEHYYRIIPEESANNE